MLNFCHFFIYEMVTIERLARERRDEALAERDQWARFYDELLRGMKPGTPVLTTWLSLCLV